MIGGLGAGVGVGVGMGVGDGVGVRVGVGVGLTHPTSTVATMTTKPIVMRLLIGIPSF